MPEIDANGPRFAHALFCDDIRLEVGNKVTLVGIYQGDMFLNEMPAFVPRMGVAFYVSTPIGEPISKFGFRISRGDDVIVEASPADTSELPRQEPLDGHDAVTRRTIAFSVPLPPMTFAEPCTLRAVVNIDGIETVAAKLRVRVALTAEVDHNAS
jgi:hypothetical protein